MLLAAACATDDDRSVRVFAAASLAGAFGELERRYEAAHPGVDVEVVTAGSSRLREQLLEGSPGHVFASAASLHVEALVEADLTGATPAIFATNQLVIATPADNPGGVSSLDDLGDASLLVGLCDPEVPCGALAVETLEVAGVEARPDTLEPDVASLRSKLAAGELDVALVYVTDVIADDGLQQIGPAAVGPSTPYPIVVLDSAPPDAARFVEFVLSPEGRQVLDDAGFGAP